MTAKRAGTKLAPPSISFATALHRVRSLRQHAAVLAHLRELVITRFFAEGVGNEPEYIAMLGREEVIIEAPVVEKVLGLLSEEIDRVRATTEELETGQVAFSSAPQGHVDDRPSAESGTRLHDEVVQNSASARTAESLRAGA